MEKISKKSLYTGFKVLLSYIKIYKKQIVTLSLLGIISALGNGFIPYITGRFFDAITSPVIVPIMDYQLPLYAVLLIILAVVQVITYIFDWRIIILSEYFSNTIWIDYIARGYGYLIGLPMSFHKKHKIGEIENKINIAANALETVTGRVIIDLAPQVLSIVVALIIAFYMQPLLAAFLIGGLCIFSFALIKNVKPLGEIYKRYWGVLGESFGDWHDAIVNTFAIKQATAETYETQKLTVKTKSAIPLWVSLTQVWSTINLYQRFTILLTQLVTFVFSVVYIHQGIMTIGELLAFQAYAAMIFGPFIIIARNWQVIHNGIINIQESEEILTIPQEIYEPTDAVDIHIKGDIEFKNVFFSYDSSDRKILQDISFRVKAGQKIALVGESGVGKSTLIDLVSGYHFATEGKVVIDGVPIERISLTKLRSHIAVVPQEVVLFNDTIMMNIKYGNFHATDEEVREASRKAHALEFIEKFPDQWNQIVGERGVKLSVGQKQRVAIARAILRDPRILILDEPTSALDAGSEKIITESLEKLMAGKTTFIIAHRLSTVRRADIILVFKEGRIVESGKHDELLQIEGGEYRRLYELQIGLHE